MKVLKVLAISAVLAFGVAAFSVSESRAEQKCWQQCDGNGNCFEQCVDVRKPVGSTRG